MKKVLRYVVQYLVPLAAALALLLWLYQGTDLGEVWREFKRANPLWVVGSLVPWLGAHLFRALRWNQLLRSSGHSPRVFTSFLAIVASYFANLLLPRLGEISRCALIKKTDQVDMDTAVGTVVLDRMLDLVMLALVTVMGFFLVSDVLIGFLQPLLTERLGAKGETWVYLGVGFLLLMGAGLLVYRYREALSSNPVGKKAERLLKGVLRGMLSIRKVDRPVLFVFYSAMIWVCYYYFSYLLIKALPISAHFGWEVGFATLILGSFGMAAPVQGGIGPYHFMVAGGFMFFGMAEEPAKIAAGFLHTVPTVFMFVLGGIAFLTSWYMGSVRGLKEAASVQDDATG